jgi:hypothetical protein
MYHKINEDSEEWPFEQVADSNLPDEYSVLVFMVAEGSFPPPPRPVTPLYRTA